MRESVPSDFAIGESLSWKKTYSDYPADDGWTLNYYFRGVGEGFDVEADAEGSSFIVTVPKTLTENMSVGRYSFQAFVAKGDEVIEVDAGEVSVFPSLSALTPSTSYDGRSQNEKILEAIDAALEGKATKDQLDYSIGDRQLRRYDINEMLKMRQTFQKLVNEEKLRERRKKGLGIGKTFYTRFDRPR